MTLRECPERYMKRKISENPRKKLAVQELRESIDKGRTLLIVAIILIIGIPVFDISVAYFVRHDVKMLQIIDWFILAFFTILLYRGNKWVRWLMGISFVIIPILTMITALTDKSLSSFEFLYGIIASLLFESCGVTILFLPSVKAFFEYQTKRTYR